MTASQAHPVPREDIPALVFAEEVRLVYGAYLVGAGGTLAVAVMIAAVLWLPAPRGPLLAWLGLMGGLALVRFLMGRAYLRVQPATAEAPRWARSLRWLVFLTGAAWGCGIFLLPPGVLSIPSMFFVICLYAVTVAGSATFGPAPGLFRAFMIPLVLPALAWTLLPFPEAAWSITALFAFGGLWTDAQARRNQATTEEGLRLHFENLALVVDLQEARERAEAAALSKSEFLANMSHEIRTPMNAVLGFVGLSLRQNLSPKVRDYLEKVHASGQSLLGIINDILDFSKIEAGKLELEATPFRLSDVLKQVGDLFSHRAAEAGLDFSVSMGAAVPDGLVGDPLRLGQILINLAGNALKFTSAGHVQVRVEILRRVGDSAHLWFYVQDTGIGMTEEQRTRLFQAFAQADSSTTRQFGGTGLGLSIAQRLVEKMGGEIVVLSQVGKGSTFAFSAPFPLDSTLPPRQASSPESLRGKRALVVDDSPVIREILTEQLWSFGMEAQAVGSGTEALAVLETKSFAVVLMDWRMPGMDGLEASQRIRAQTQTPPAIIMVTAYGREDVARQAEAAGFSGFLVKPITPSLLLETLLEVLPGEPGQAFAPTLRVPVVSKGPSLLGLRVLVVDDNAINLEVARDLLTSEGVIVEVAQSGPEALKRVQQRAFHAVFMDIQMPGMDGYEVVSRIRPEHPTLPIIAMTAHALPRYRDQCLAAGMNDFITKPIEPDKLLATLAHWTVGEALPPESVVEPDTAPPLWERDQALRRLRGNEALLRRLLQDFRKQQESFAALLRERLANRDPQGLEEAVHALKGVAGAVGAPRLQVEAGRAEELLREGESSWEALEGLAETVVATLAAMAVEPAGASLPDPGPTADPATLIEILAQRLKSGDPSAEDTWRELSRALPGPAFQGPLEGIGEALEAFDFKRAGEMLEGLQEAMRKPTEGGA